jgi:hypothetical protein
MSSTVSTLIRNLAGAEGSEAYDAEEGHVHGTDRIDFYTREKVVVTR